MLCPSCKLVHDDPRLIVRKYWYIVAARMPLLHVQGSILELQSQVAAAKKEYDALKAQQLATVQRKYEAKKQMVWMSWQPFSLMLSLSVVQAAFLHVALSVHLLAAAVLRFAKEYQACTPTQAAVCGF